MQNKANFQKSQMNVIPLVIMDYEKISNWTLGENKPNSKPNKANLYFTTENTEYAEKKDISVSDCSIKKYALYAISPCSLRTRRLMKNKAKTKPKQTQFKANLRKARMKLNFYSTALYENRLAEDPQKANNNPIGKKRIIKGDKK